MKKFFNEFRAFAMRGNVLNLAVGVIIGASFQSIVTSLTDNILKPVLGIFTGSSFDALKISLFDNEIKYGAFITSVINFIIMSFIVFLLVKFVNSIIAFHKKPAPPTTRDCPYCTTKINVKATRCPACTSEIPAGEEKADDSATATAPAAAPAPAPTPGSGA